MSGVLASLVGATFGGGGAAGAWTLVAETTARATSVSYPGSPASGDIILVVAVSNGGGPFNVNTVSGGTYDEVRVGSVGPSDWSVGVVEYAGSGTGLSSPTRTSDWAIQVWRPPSGTATYVNDNNADAASGAIDPPNLVAGSITEGDLLVAFGVAEDQTWYTYTAPTDFGDLLGLTGDGTDGMCLIATREASAADASGGRNPSAFGSSGSPENFDWAAITLSITYS